MRLAGLACLALAALVLFACPARAGDEVSEAELREQVRSVLREHPELILEALEGQEEALYDAVQRGLEAKRQARLRRRREAQARDPVRVELDESRPFLGPEDAEETIVVFTDLQFPACAKGFAKLEALLEEQPGRFRVAFRHRPMGFHPHSEAAARWFEAALEQDQDRAFEYLGLLFRGQRRVFQEGQAALAALAEQVGLDADRLRREAASEEIARRVEEDLARARELGFTAAPVAVLRGVVLTGPVAGQRYLEVLEMSREGSAQKP